MFRVFFYNIILNVLAYLGPTPVVNSFVNNFVLTAIFVLQGLSIIDQWKETTDINKA